MKLSCGTLLLGLAIVVGASAQDIPAQDIQERITECEACHGPGGVSTEEDVPSLAGKSVTYIREVLDQFYYYERHCSTTTYRHGDRPKTPMSMCNVANSLSDEEKQALAEHFANVGAAAAE